MKEYEIVKEVFNPCAGDQRPDTCEIDERAVEDPESYVRALYQQERRAEFLLTERDGSTVIEVLFDYGRKHRYTFSEL